MRRLCLAAFVLCFGCTALNRADPASTALISEASSSRADPAGSFKVVTYNVHGEGPEAIAGALADTRELADADWVFLQEIEAHPKEGATRAALIARRLGMASVYAPGYGLPNRASHGVALLSRYPLEDVRKIELPRKFVVVNSARRVAIGATARVGARRVRLYVVHLDNRLNPADRRSQLAPVVEDAKRYADLPTVIAGDVNTSPFCWVARLLPVPCGVQDSRLEAFVRRGGFETPVRESGATSRFLDMRLDAIYTRGVEVYEFGVAAQVSVSDHLPLWARVRLDGAVLPSRHARARDSRGAGRGAERAR